MVIWNILLPYSIKEEGKPNEIFPKVDEKKIDIASAVLKVN